jgi:hypothetical protein
MNAKAPSGSGDEGGRPSAGMQGRYDARSPWRGEQTPWAVYFYYDTRSEAEDGSTTGSMKVYEWDAEYPITEARLKAEVIPSLTSNARLGGNEPAPSGSAVSDIPWKKIAYLVFALDTGEEYDPEEPVQVRRQPGNQPNYSFFDGGVGSIPVPGQEPIQAVWMINYRKNEHGGELTPSDDHQYALRFNKRGGRGSGGSDKDKGDDRNFGGVIDVGRGVIGVGGGGGRPPPRPDDNGNNTGRNIPPPPTRT